MKLLLLFLLRAYQVCLGPFLGPAKCRFFPTCSNYAAEAVSRHGAWKGGMLAARRVCKCHPWHGGGYDPVPASPSFPSTPADGHERRGTS